MGTAPGRSGVADTTAMDDRRKGGTHSVESRRESAVRGQLTWTAMLGAVDLAECLHVPRAEGVEPWGVAQWRESGGQVSGSVL